MVCGVGPYRVISSSRKVVCKHWLRGLCKRGDACDYLHEYVALLFLLVLEFPT